MASPSKAELITRLQNAVDILEETRLFAETNTSPRDNWVTMEDTLTQALEGDFAPEVLSALATHRAALASIISPAGVRLLLDPVFRDWGKLILAPEQASVDAILDRLYTYMIDNTDRVASRVFSFGSISAAGGNVGTGTIYRLTKDRRNFDIESGHTEARVALCVADQNTGTTRNREVFEFVGGRPSRDELDRAGSGLIKLIPAKNARDDSLALNSGFDSFAGTAAAPTAMTSWTSSVTFDSTSYSFDSSNIYLPAPDGDTTVYALNIKATATLTQRLTVRGTALDRNVPYFAQIAWNRSVGSGAGTLELHIGNQSATVVAAAQSGWQLLQITGLDDNWYRQQAEQAFDVKIVWTRTSGNLLIDDLVFVPYEEFDGTWYHVAPAATSFLVDDKFTWSDTATEAKIQRWVARGYNKYLPHATGSSVTYADP